MKKALSLIFIGLLVCLISSKALSEMKYGEEYTKDNCKEIKELLPAPVYNWLEQGNITVKTAKCEYPFKGGKKFQQASAQNAGKYSVDKEGNLTEKTSGQIPSFVYGLPFPQIEASDPQAGTKIMWNFFFTQFQTASQYYRYTINWVSYKDFERNFVGSWKRLFYTGRYSGPIPNPDGCDFKDNIAVHAPFDVAGIATMLYRNRAAGGMSKDLLWTYAPALRRIRQLSPANSSDAFLGSDIATDDAAGFRAKIQIFDWKLLGEKNILAPQASVKPAALVYSDKYKAWATDKNTPYAEHGWLHKDKKVAAWAPINVIWDVRPVYIIEGNPKDPYYNYGRQIFCVDKESFCLYNKEIYDHAGSYWKNMVTAYAWVYAPGKEEELSSWFVYTHVIVDEKSKHATVTRTFVEDPPLTFDSALIGESDFTMKALMQTGK